MTLNNRTLAGLTLLAWSAAASCAPGLGVQNQPAKDTDGRDQVAVPSAPAQPEMHDRFSYDYLQMGWIINSNVENDSGEDRDGDGLDLRASHAFGDYLFIQGSSSTPDYREAGNDVTLGDWVRVGPGVHFPLLQGDFPLDIWGQVSYDRIASAGLASTGYGLAGGLRFGATSRLELDAGVRYADTQGDLLGSNIDVTPFIYTVEALYFASPRIALTAGYRGGQTEFDGAGFNDDLDLNEFNVGLRYNYGEQANDLPALPADPPTPYNYAQVSYVVDGEFSGPGPDIDSDGGLGIEASALLSDIVFVRANLQTVDYDFDAADSDAVLSDMAFIGPGLRYGHAIGPVHADVYGQITYDRVVVADTVADGYGGEAGARLLLIPGVEFDAWYRAGVTQFSDNNNAEPRLYGLRLLLSLPNQGRWSKLALLVDYTDGEIQFDQPVLGADDVDVNALSVGLRANF